MLIGFPTPDGLGTIYAVRDHIEGFSESHDVRGTDIHMVSGHSMTTGLDLVEAIHYYNESIHSDELKRSTI